MSNAALLERINFAKQAIAAYKLVIYSYPRQIENVDEEISRLRKHQEWMREKLEKAPDLLQQTEDELGKLLKVKKQHEEKGYEYKRTKPETIERKKARYRELKKMLAALEQEIPKSLLDDDD